MPQETHSSVTLVTAAYLNEPCYSEPPPVDAPVAQSDSGLVALTRLTRVISVLLIGAFVVAIPVTLMTAPARETGQRTSGIDWIFWMVGSDKTFQGTLMESMERSREDFERRREESKSKFENFELQQFDVNQLILGPGHNSS